MFLMSWRDSKEPSHSSWCFTFSAVHCGSAVKQPLVLFCWIFIISGTWNVNMWAALCAEPCAHRQLGVTGGMSCGVFSLIFVVVQWSTEKTRLNLWALSTNQMPPAVTLAILHHAPSVKKAYFITDLDFLFSPSVCGFHFRLHFMSV